MEEKGLGGNRDILLRMFIAAVLLVLTVGTGIWMSSLGKPYHRKLFIFHKMTAFVTTVNMVFFIVSLMDISAMELPLALLLRIGGLSVLSLFASGAMLTKGILSNNQATTVHSFASILAIVSIGIFLFVVVWRSMGSPA